jgi:hypothetical protein
MSQQTDQFDSTNLPRPNRLPPVEMVNNPSSADAMEGKNTDRTQKERKKKKKKTKDEGTIKWQPCNVFFSLHPSEH